MSICQSWEDLQCFGFSSAAPQALPGVLGVSRVRTSLTLQLERDETEKVSRNAEARNRAFCSVLCCFVLGN